MDKTSEAVEWLLQNPQDMAELPDRFHGLSLEKIKASIRKSSLLQSPRFEKFISMDDCHISDVTKQYIKSYLEQLDKAFERGCGLYFWSNSPGSGKTTAMKIVATELLKTGRGVLFESMVNIKNQLKAEFDDPKISPLRTKLNLVDVLILDDLGSEVGSKWLDEILKDIIDERYNKMKVLMITTNFPMDKLPFNNKIIDRLKSMLKPLHFPEKSFRQLGI